MTGFQLLAAPMAGLLAVRSLLRILRGDRPRVTAWLGAIVWTGAAVAVLLPDLTTRAARTLGIGRGADLLIYLVAIAFLVSSFYFYQKYRKLSADLTALTRAIAVQQAMEGRAPTREQPGEFPASPANGPGRPGDPKRSS